MQASKIIEAMGLAPYGAGSTKLRELINFHLALGASEEEVPALVRKKAEEVRDMQQGTADQRKEQAMQYLWQRYRGQWPEAKANHRAESGSGRTTYYYSAPGHIKAPPNWGFVLENDHFVLATIWPFKDQIIRLADYQARFNFGVQTALPTEQVRVETIESVETVEEVPEDAPPKREGTQTQIKTRPDQLTFAQSVKHNCFDKCVITGSRLHVRCSAAHLVEHKDGGADYYTNGLWMRWDIHKMFDDRWCAIDPATMKIYFLKEAIELDADLAAYQGKALGELRRPINPDFLSARWEAFEAIRNG